MTLLDSLLICFFYHAGFTGLLILSQFITPDKSGQSIIALPAFLFCATVVHVSVIISKTLKGQKSKLSGFLDVVVVGIVNFFGAFIDTIALVLFLELFSTLGLLKR